MFSHSEFRVIAFEDLPLDEDIFLMDERWMSEYESACINMFNGLDYPNVGYISYAAARGVGGDHLELSWYPNIIDRFHEMVVKLPREAFVTCVDTPRWDGKPRIFVKSSWLSGLHLRPYSAFALIDAIGVKDALSRGQLSGPSLVRLRERIDVIAADNPAMAFVSFADSILVKMNWFVGQYDSDISYSYDPEALIRIMPAVAGAFREEVDLAVYAAVAQGVNEYDDTALLHLSSTGNHISLNSLGLPFAQLLAIDGAARAAIRAGEHGPGELYIDEHFYHSLRFRSGFEKAGLPRAGYRSPLAARTSHYFYTDRQTILVNLDPAAPAPRRKRPRTTTT
jgi:hypothetical protein